MFLSMLVSPICYECDAIFVVSIVVTFLFRVPINPLTGTVLVRKLFSYKNMDTLN